MSTQTIKKKFEEMGARIKFRKTRNLFLDVRKDKKGEFFDVGVEDPESLSVLDVQPEDRHLLLMFRRANSRPHREDIKEKYLCGHDERSWFIASVGTFSGAATVKGAKEALQPREVQENISKKGVKEKKRFARKNEAFKRQGEWFFIPQSDMQIADRFILKDEPIRRGRGKPHNCEFLFRTGGTQVWVCNRHPNGVSEAEYKKIIETSNAAKLWGWRRMVRDAGVYVKGRITHKDHRTIILNGWHKVVPNTETAWGQSRMAFLD